MLFWIIALALSLMCAAILARAILRGRPGDAPPAAYDLKVYRDQLKEVDRDLARGIVGPEDAERLRTEISRRILAADAKLQADSSSGGQPNRSGKLGGLVALVLVLGGSGLIYTQLGAPGYRDLPLSQQRADDLLHLIQVKKVERID